MNKYHSFKDIAEDLWQIEQEFSLLNFEVDDIKIWQVVRMEVYGILLSKLLNLGGSHKSSSTFHKVINTFTMLKNSIVLNPYTADKSDILVFPHDRVISVNEEYVDIYTKYLVDELLKQHENILVLEKPYVQKHYTKKNKYTKYLDYSILLNAIKYKTYYRNLKLDTLYIHNIEKIIKDTFNVSIDLRSIFISNLKKFKSYYSYYHKLLQKLSPKKIYLVVSYSYPWLVKAAQDLNIEVVELQHGTFSKYHLGYSYPYDRNLVDYFPDKFLVWNQYWKEMIPLPIEDKNIQILPFEFQKRELEKYKNISKIRNQVIVLSQGLISNQLAKVILDNFDFFKNKTIKYKLHPGEFQRYKEYEYLNQLNSYDNVEIVLESNLYELLAQSEYQVGVSSTALYEGLEFNLKTILADLASVEYMEKLIEDNKIHKILYTNTTPIKEASC